MDLLFIKSDVEYRQALQRLASLEGKESEEAREEVTMLTELVRAYENRLSPKESKKLAEAIQRLTREGALDRLDDCEGQ